MWTGEVVAHAGTYYSLDDVRLDPAPMQPGGPPIIVAGRREPAMRRAAWFGDGWMPYLYSPRRYAESKQVILDAAAAIGRDLEQFRWCVYLHTAVDGAGDRARRFAAERLSATYGGDFAQMVDRVAATGTPDMVAEQLNEFVQAGVRHFVFVMLARDRWVDAATELLDTVVSQLRPSPPAGSNDPASDPAVPLSGGETVSSLG